MDLHNILLVSDEVSNLNALRRILRHEHTKRTGRHFLTPLAAFDTVIDLSFLVGPPLAAAAIRVSGTIAATFWLALLPALISLPLALSMSREVSLAHPQRKA